MLISFNPNFVWSIKFVLSISSILELTQNYTVIFFKAMRRKHTSNISRFFTCKHKISESNAKTSTHYWIVCLYSKNVWYDVFMSDKFLNFFRNMFNTKTTKINGLFFVTKQSNPVYASIFIFVQINHVTNIFY